MDQVSPIAPRPKRLALGTVQFGLAYGIAGRGVRLLDTASAYGDIEVRLARLADGLGFDIVSKIPAVPEHLDEGNASRFVLEAAMLSLERLGPSLKALMMHRGADLAGTRGKHLADTLGNWCARNGLTFGASCYEPGETAELARSRGIRLTQLPGNALDQRVAQSGAALDGVEVHLRSAFLQGLLLLPQAQASARLPQAASALQLWHAHCERRGLDPLEAALGVVRSFATVDVVVVGVDSLAQWREIAQAWERAEPSSAPEIACMDTTVIDPRLWASKT